MGDRKSARSFEEAWELRRRQPGQDEPGREEEIPESVLKALEMGERLADADYSSDSRIREQLRARLLTHAARDAREGQTPPKLGWFRTVGWGLVALVLVVALAWSIQNLVPILPSIPEQAAALATTVSNLSGEIVSPSEQATPSRRVAVGVGTPPPAAGGVLRTSTPLPPNAGEWTEVSGLPRFAPAGSRGRVAYLSDGDIWTVSLDNGETVRQTEDGGYSQPLWSEGGEWLAYRQGTNRVWLVREDGRGWILETSGEIREIAWSPAEQKLAYATDGDLRIANPGSFSIGSDILTIPSPNGGGTSKNLVWSPKGDQIAFQTLEQPGIWIASLQGAELAQIHSGPSTLHGWTGDGVYLVFWQVNPDEAESIQMDGAPLALLPATGGDPIPVRNSVLVYPDQVSLTRANLGWIAMVTGGGRETWTNKGLSVMGPQINENLAPDGQSASSPSWSPDASRVAFSAMPDAGHVWGGPGAAAALMQRRLWIADVPSGELKQLTFEPAFRDEFPQWSRDGSTLLFVRLDDEGRASLWQIDAQGGDPFMVVFGLSPNELGQDSIGVYGHIAWYDLFDWDQ